MIEFFIPIPIQELGIGAPIARKRSLTREKNECHNSELGLSFERLPRNPKIASLKSSKHS